MTCIQDVFDFLNRFAPLEAAESWDNPGLLVGSADAGVSRILTALDITDDVIRQATEWDAELIVAHHPVIFAPLRRIDQTHPVYRLAANGISALCWHTNLDVAVGGVADTLARQLGLQHPFSADAYTRIGTLPQALSPSDFVSLVNQALHTRARGCLGSSFVSSVAVFGGALDENSLPALLQADAVVLGECKHHVRLQLCQSGKTVLEAGHFATEHAIAAVLCAQLSAAFPSLQVKQAKEAAPFIQF